MVASVTAVMSHEAIISLRDVTKSFGSHTVLEGISFDVPKGRISACMGPSGTGKSVLLKNIIGLLRPVQPCTYVRVNGIGKPVKNLIKCNSVPLFQSLQ